MSQINDSLRQEYLVKYNAEVKLYSLYSSSLTNGEKTRIEQIFLEKEPCDTVLTCINASYSFNDSIHYEYEDYSISLSKTVFQKSKHLVCKIQDTIFEINKRIKFGTRFKMPETELIHFNVTFKNEVIKFENSEWTIFFNPRIGCIDDILGQYCQTKMFFDNERNNVYFYLEGGDGGTFYSVVFVFNENKYKGKVIYIL